MSLAAILLFALAAPSRAAVVPPVPERPYLVLAPSAAPLSLAPSAGVYERRGVGLLAVDLKDSTRLHAELGNRKAHALVSAALDYAEASAALFDGKVVRRLGDGYLIAFPKLENAVAAGTRIQAGAGALRGLLGGPVEFRAGAAAGRVVVDPAVPDVFGAAAEKAVELSASAEGGKLAVDKGGTVETLAPVPDPAALDGLDLAPRLSKAEFEDAAILFASPAGAAESFARGRRAAHAALKRFHAAAREAVEREGGFVVKTEGETVMAAFPSPSAARRAAEAIARLPRARVGVTWGRVLREDRLEGPDYFGNRVNAAARLMRLAGEGEAAIAASALEDPGSASESAAVKGFPGPIKIRRFRPSNP